MNTPAALNPRMTESVAGLEFIIVGASIAGLASAIALKASGHSVLVLEKDAALGGTSSIPSGCARVPPNGCKILFDWGLEAETRANAVIGDGYVFHKYDGKMPTGRDYIGITRFDGEMLSEARGEYLQFRHHDLLRMLYNEAIKLSEHLQNDTKMKQKEMGSGPRVIVRFGAEVVDVDSNACSVTLRSGEIQKGDAIIGADGACGVIRRMLLEEEGVEPASDHVPTGLAMYNAMIPRELAVKDEDLVSFYDSKCTVEIGSNRGAITCLSGKEQDIALMVYTPDSTQDGTWTEEAERKFTDVLGPCDPEIQKLAALAGQATCVQIQECHDLESWVSESGRVLALGEAAHPLPAGSLQAYCIALEDGAFIGKIFSHTRNRDRVPEFLYAFQEHREERCSRMREMEKQYMGFITLPDGEMQMGRDAAMRANHAAGRYVMDGLQGEMDNILNDTRMVFSYEPTDDADEWWMAWGRFRDDPNAQTDLKTPTSTTVSSFALNEDDSYP
ncbi:hypothetical protein C8R44DRAFT_785327 [Mycena epipterygia]|nr:hypothetical protein C8R44DRAFT_785327 [Mycena epipterygia]